MTLGEFIKEYRNNHEITQKQLAEELGIPGSNIIQLVETWVVFFLQHKHPL